jgi:Putative lumazine-binding
MKLLIFLCLCAVVAFLACGQAKSQAPQAVPPVEQKTISPEQSEVETATMQFMESADKSDIAGLDAVMHTQFRLLLNRVFGDAVTTMDKVTYLKMVTDKKIGGIPRESKIITTIVIGNVAMVELTSSSAKAEFHSFLNLIKEPDGKWRLVSDTPNVKFKN